MYRIMTGGPGRQGQEQDFAHGVDDSLPDSFNKWWSAEEPRRFHGWTIIAPVPRGAELLNRAVALMEQLPQEFGAGTFSRHPATSMHMTVFPGRNETNGTATAREPETDLMSNALTALHSLENADLHLGPLEVEIDRVSIDKTNAQILVRPVDEERVRRFRDQVAEITGVRHPNHDTYHFHMSLGYVLQPQNIEDNARRAVEERFTEALADLGTIQLQPAAFSIFDSMVSFPPILNF